MRDLILGRPTKDFDIATNCPVEEIKNLFPDANQKKPYRYGVFELKADDLYIEIAHFREDYDYDGRHSKVRLVDSVERDLKRRDFTINALALDPSTMEVLDLFDGLYDIRHSELRTIGDPEIRFKEDALRILRGIRFATKLDFQIEPKTQAAMTRYADKVKDLSHDWLRKEFIGIMESEKSHRGVKLLHETGLDKRLLPGAFTEYEEPEIIIQWLKKADEAGFDHVKKLAILLRKENPKKAEQVLNKLKFPKTEIKKITGFIDRLEWLGKWDSLSPDELVDMVDNDDFEGLLSLAEVFYEQSKWKNIKGSFKNILENSKNEYILNGEDIQELLDIKPGKMIKEILVYVRYNQLLGEIKTVEDAKKYAKVIVNKLK
ncbi:CCA tRNA nucleotidyltransferase [bacterium]|nr:CCA tRNA nucleotidyltransferase [bacterium]